MKVVWLCHFSNSEIRSLYPRKGKSGLYNIARKILGLTSKQTVNMDFAPWVSSAIYEMKGRSDVELHVISPQTDLAGQIFEFSADGIYYHFFNPNVTLFLMHAIKNNKLWKKVQVSSHYVNRFIKGINPDIINLIGAENPYHSCAVLDVDKNIPVIVTLQTIFNNLDRLKYQPNADKTKRWYIDELIHQKCTYFGVEDKLYRDLLLKDNPNAITLNTSCFPALLPPIKDVAKNYDFVNFAYTHGSKKGTQDSILAISQLISDYPDIRLNIVGGMDEATKNDVNELIEKYKLSNNIVFTPAFADQKDLFQHIVSSKAALLPIKLDVIAGTVIQSMFYKLPVITYITAGTPTLNKQCECVLLAKNSDVDDLVRCMKVCLCDKDRINKMIINAKGLSEKICYNTERGDRLIECYTAIINHFNNGVSIDSQLLYM